jgi:hypothetical protein
MTSVVAEKDVAVASDADAGAAASTEELPRSTILLRTCHSWTNADPK